MKRGDVVRVVLPQPRGTPGREQFGTRPAIVLQDEPRLASLQTVVIVPLTSTLAAQRFAGSTRVLPTPQNGLSVESVAMSHQIRAIDRQRVKETLGEISQEDLDSLVQEIRSLLNV